MRVWHGSSISGLDLMRVWHASAISVDLVCVLHGRSIGFYNSVSRRMDAALPKLGMDFVMVPTLGMDRLDFVVVLLAR
jgi:hypothetical protein